MLSPRVGIYTLIKTEHIDRFNYPNNWFDVATSGVRYTLAQTLKLGTLGIFNWNIFTQNPEDDFYLKVMGRPFSVSYDSAQVPYFHDGKLFASRDFLWYEQSPDAPRQVKFFFNGNGVTSANVEKLDRKTPYEDQTYLSFSIVSPKLGLPLAEMSKIAGAQQDIDMLKNIRTTQFSSEELAGEIKGVTDSLKAFIIQKQILVNYREKIENAKTPEEVAKYEELYKKELEEKVTKLLTPETRTAIGAELDQKAKAKKQELGGVNINPNYFYEGSNVEFTLFHTRKTSNEQYISRVHRSNGDLVSVTPNISYPSNTNELNLVFVKLPGFPFTADKYKFAFRNSSAAQEMNAYFNVVKRPIITSVQPEGEKIAIVGENINKDLIKKVVLLDAQNAALSIEADFEFYADQKKILITTKTQEDALKIKKAKFEMLHSLAEITQQ